MATKLQIRRDTAANWASSNPVLASGELGLDTGSGRIKVGDGTTAWSSLPSLGGFDSSNTASNWTSANTTLGLGQVGLESDTKLIKIGDGTTAWTSQPYIGQWHIFRLAANGSAIGSAIADYFGTSSTITLDAGSSYEVEFELYFLKTTAGTVTFTLTSSQTPVNVAAYYVGTAVGGVATVGTAQTAGLVTSTATASALPATGSLTTAVNHHYTIKAMVDVNATTASTFKLQCTESAGTITPLRGSNYKVRKLPSANSGAFA